MFDNRVCHVTYTHTDCADVWPVYFRQMQRFFPSNLEHVVAVNRLHEGLPSDVRAVTYDDSRPYPQRLLSCLESLSEFDYVFFDHEDMFLYDKPDFEELNSYYRCIASGELDHIRLIKGGDCIFEEMEGASSLYRLSLRSKWIFSIQPGFWNRRALMEVLKANPNVNIWDFELKSQKAVKKMKLKAAFSYREGAKRGLHHFDNDIYPYVATAVVKGKWNLSEYKHELGAMLEACDIDPTLRGTL